jgi:hypothetical protein
MSHSAKIVDDSVVAPIVVSLVQIYPSHQVLAETYFSNKPVTVSN